MASAPVPFRSFPDPPLRGVPTRESRGIALLDLARDLSQRGGAVHPLEQPEPLGPRLLVFQVFDMSVSDEGNRAVPRGPSTTRDGCTANGTSTKAVGSPPSIPERRRLTRIRPAPSPSQDLGKVRTDSFGPPAVSVYDRRVA